MGDAPQDCPGRGASFVSRAMRYALLLHHLPETGAGVSYVERRAALDEAHVLFADPRVLTATTLKDAETATTVRLRDGRGIVTDGPAAGAAEVLDAMIVIEVEHLDEALGVAQRVLAARPGASVEVRPVADP
jgi:hypothetical protein